MLGMIVVIAMANFMTVKFYNDDFIKYGMKSCLMTVLFST